jgi:hypothetical protein
MAGPYPLATLGPTITAAGITIPAYADIYSSLQATFYGIYGSDSYLDPDSQDGQMLATLAQGYFDCNATSVAIFNAFNPAYAQGTQLSSLVRINGIARGVATNSSVVVTVSGSPYTIINNGVIQDQNGNLWNLPALVAIPSGGEIIVTAVAQQQGNIAAPINTVNIIATAIYGWTGVNNPTYAAAAGAPVQPDAALRIAQAYSVALPAVSPLDAIFAAIGQLSGVTNFTVYENQTAETDSNGVPSHSIDVIVQGGDLTQIAQTIQLKKSPGTGTYGATTEIVEDAFSGLPIAIRFDILAETPIYVAMTIKALAGFVTPTVDTITAALANFVSTLPIGGEVYYTQVLSQAQLDAVGLGATFYIVSLYIGTSPSPVTTANIPIAFNAIANLLAANIAVTVT